MLFGQPGAAEENILMTYSGRTSTTLSSKVESDDDDIKVDIAGNGNVNMDFRVHWDKSCMAIAISQTIPDYSKLLLIVQLIDETCSNIDKAKHPSTCHCWNECESFLLQSISKVYYRTPIDPACI